MRSPPHSTKVLVVDDDPVTRELLAHVLRAGGFQPIAVGTGEHALLTLIKNRGDIDWLFTKVQLPGLVSGAILAEEFHRAKPGHPVIYASYRSASTSTEPSLVASAAAPMEVLALLKRLHATHARRTGAPLQAGVSSTRARADVALKSGQRRRVGSKRIGNSG